MKKLIAISGSTKAASQNTFLLHALAKLAQGVLEVELFESIADLPHFNPDLDKEGMAVPEHVARLRKALASADIVAISTPEYAHGVPGSLKNALDWIVSSGELVHKPVILISASPMPTGGEKALTALLLTLKMMTAYMPEGWAFSIPFIRQQFDAANQLTNEALTAKLTQLIQEAATLELPSFYE